MDVIGLYAAVTVRDLKAAEDWWTKLLGRGPDDRPMDSLIQWRGFGSAGIQLFTEQDGSAAGHSRMTLVVPVMDAERARLAEADLTLGDDIHGDFGIVAQIRDPEGNLVTLAEPPKGWKA